MKKLTLYGLCFVLLFGLVVFMEMVLIFLRWIALKIKRLRCN